MRIKLSSFAAGIDAPVFNEVPARYGVYLLARADVITYIGSSVSPWSRVAAHRIYGRTDKCSESCDGYHAWDSVAIIECESMAEAEAVERVLVYTLRPICNKRIREPSESDIAVTKSRVDVMVRE